MKIYLLFPLSHNIIHSIWKFTLELFLAKSLNYFKQLLVLFTKYFYSSAFWLVVRLLVFFHVFWGHVTSSGQWIVSTSNLCHFPEEYLTACEILSWGLLFQEVIHKKFLRWCPLCQFKLLSGCGVLSPLLTYNGHIWWARNKLYHRILDIDFSF